MSDKIYSYDVVVVFNPKTEEKQKEECFKQVETWMESNSAKVAKKDHLGQMDMVYPIKGTNRGDYWSLGVEASKTLKLRDLNIYFNREASIIRYLVLKK